MLRCLVILLLFVVAGFNYGEPVTTVTESTALVPAKPVDDDDSKAKETEAKKEFEGLQAEFKSAMADLKAEVAKADSKQAQAELLIMKNPAKTFAKKHLLHAKKYLGTKASLNSTLFTVGIAKGEQKNEAMKFLIENYSSKIRLDKIAGSFKEEVPSQDIEEWYLLMIEKAETDKIKASVRYDYAKYVSQFPTFRKTLEINPAVAQRLPEMQLEYIMDDRTESQVEAMVENLETIIKDFPKVKRGRDTYGALATRELFDIQNLQIGQVAPDIEGKDLDGIPFKLSDYRGKVVMLDFWGHWCPPCRAMYPQERELVKALADKPFVLIGVNSDRNPEVVKEAVRNEGLSWRHFWNGPKGTSGPIADKWNVEGWPTVYLIDAEGVIRYREIQGEDVDRGIEKLMAEIDVEVKL